MRQSVTVLYLERQRRRYFPLPEIPDKQLRGLVTKILFRKYRVSLSGGQTRRSDFLFLQTFPILCLASIWQSYKDCIGVPIDGIVTTRQKEAYRSNTKKVSEHSSRRPECLVYYERRYEITGPFGKGGYSSLRHPSLPGLG